MPNQRVTHSDDSGARVIRFEDRRLFDDAVVREVSDQVFGAMPRSGPIAMVLDFSGVETISSSMLGKLLLLQRRVDNSGGQLRLCELSNIVKSVFATTNLDRLFAIDRDLNESLEAIRRSKG